VKILGIETATSVCSAAIAAGADQHIERNLDTPQVHSQKLLTLIDEVLKLAGETVETLDGIAVSIGPGSFTGLRIGLSTAKGLAYACKKPLLAVSTLQALVFGAKQNCSPDQQLILAVLESRRAEFYAAMYRVVNDRLQESFAPAAFHYNDLISACPSGEEILVTGNGAMQFFEYCQKETDVQLSLTVLSDAQRRCSALPVALLGGELLAHNSVADLASLEPMYIKEFYTISQPQQPIGR
jgi:tRNA threonylcarbamoyladenosine biosynthesis protein TsaB